jgi:hypothetical protein
MRRIYSLLLVCGALLSTLPSFAQKKQPWEPLGANYEIATLRSSERLIVPKKYMASKLDLQALKVILARAPMEADAARGQRNTQLAIPMPDGSLETFSIYESPIVEEPLYSRMPEIRTYAGQNDKGWTMRFDLTPHGFHAMIFTDKGTVYIDPYSRGNTAYYNSYFKRDYASDKPIHPCLTEGRAELPTDDTQNHNDNVLETNARTLSCNGAVNLRTYRAVFSCTAEYGNFHGGTVALAQAAIVTTVNRINMVYERDVAIRMTLVGNNSSVVYVGSTNSDPYNNDNASTLIGQSQSNITAVIGSANYDIGHTLSTGAGGLAGLGVVCNSTNKARGVTGTSNPVGDPFDIDYVAHEVGHQFSGNHSFNGSTGSCTGTNRNGGTAYEPGSGSTIQAYAGICSPQDIQSNSDDYFHAISLLEILTYSRSGTGSTCGTAGGSTNTSPQITSGTTGLTIPISTPFTLTGSATDANGDALTYCWEQYDLGPQGDISASSTTAPIFRSFDPTTSPSRTFPQLSDVINGTTTYGEVLPTVTRTLNFRLTARDNRNGANGGGGVCMQTFTINTTAAAGPFLVTAPNTAVSWAVGSPQTVTWNVANTTASPVSCANVDILLSIDGGNTYPITLASNTPNDGSQTITVPSNITTQARVKVFCSSNIFYDISNTDFTIFSSAPDFSMAATPTTQTVCAGTSTTYTINLSAISGYTGSVSLSASGNPSGTTVAFSPSSVAPTGSSTMTVSGTAAPGTYTVTASGTDGTLTHTTNVTYIVTSTSVGATSLSSPSNGATGVATSTALSWAATSGAATYDLQVATDAAFTNIVSNQTGLTGTSYTASGLSTITTYYWRVRGVSSCATGAWPTAFSFTTLDVPPCSDVMLDGGFELDAGDWTEYSAQGEQLIGAWTSGGVPTPNTGSYHAWLGYVNNEVSIVYQSVTIPADAISAMLTYYRRIISSENNCTRDEGGVVTVDLVNNTYTPRQTVGLCATNATSGYVVQTYDMLSFAGQTINIGFYAETNNSNASSFLVDDAQLDICVPGPTSNCMDNLVINDNPIASDAYSADLTITSAGVVPSGNTVSFESQEITLQTGFHAQAGCDFHAFIGDCTSGAKIVDGAVVGKVASNAEGARSIPMKQGANRKNTDTERPLSGLDVQVLPNPFSNTATVRYFVPSEGTASVTLTDLNGRALRTLSNGQAKAAGWHEATIESNGLAKGVYLLHVRTATESTTKKVVLVQ